MKALTVHQPSAWAIAAGHKIVENRSQATRYRGRFYVHAGKTFDPAIDRWMVEVLHEPIWRGGTTHPSVPFERQLEGWGMVGAIIGEADLVGVLRYPTVDPGWSSLDGFLERDAYERMDDLWPLATRRVEAWSKPGAGGDEIDAPFRWLIANARLYDDPIPCRGQLGFWTPPVEVRA